MFSDLVLNIDGFDGRLFKTWILDVIGDQYCPLCAYHLFWWGRRFIVCKKMRPFLTLSSLHRMLHNSMRWEMTITTVGTQKLLNKTCTLSLALRYVGVIARLKGSFSSNRTVKKINLWTNFQMFYDSKRRHPHPISYEEIWMQDSWVLLPTPVSKPLDLLMILSWVKNVMQPN